MLRKHEMVCDLCGNLMVLMREGLGGQKGQRGVFVWVIVAKI